MDIIYKKCDEMRDGIIFPFINKEAMSQCEYDLLLHRLVEESRAIISEFDCLFDTFCTWLDCHNVCLESYKDILQNIRGIDSPDCNINLLLEDRCLQISEAEKHKTLHKIVNEYVNWLNYYLLEVIIDRAAKKLGVTSEDFEAKVADYKGKLHSFCERCLYECPFPPMDKNNGCKRHLCVKVQMEEKYMNIKINVIRNFRGSLVKALGLCDYTLELCQAADGCVELLCSIPASIHASLFPLHNDTLVKLESLGIVKICTHGYVKERKNTSQGFDQVRYSIHAILSSYFNRSPSF